MIKSTFPEITHDKWGFEGGEKKIYSGYTNTWVREEIEGRNNWSFLYFQPVQYLFEECPEEVKYSKSKRQLMAYCRENGLYKVPISYFSKGGPRLTVWQIRQLNPQKDIYSVDFGGDIADKYEHLLFFFPGTGIQLDTVKGFIEKNIRNNTLSEKEYHRFMEKELGARNSCGINFNDVADWQ